MSLTLRAAVDRTLIEHDQTSQRYLVLTMTAPGGTTSRLPVNLALVVDASGSMSGTKLARVKEAAGFALRQLTGADRAAVIAYDDEVTVVAPSTLMTAEAKVELLSRLKGVQAGGMTNLGGGWLAGCQEVARGQAGDGQMNRVIVLTDGLANVGMTAPDKLVEHAHQLRLRGIVTSTMGIGADFNEDLLEALARHGGGRFHYVETARHIPDCIQGELGEMLQVSARKVALEITLPTGMRCSGCLNDYVLEDTARGVRVHLGDLLASDTRHVVLELSITPQADAGRLAIAAVALYVDMATGRGADTTFPVLHVCHASGDAVAAQEADEAVSRQVALLLAAKAKDEAVRLSRLGEHAAAAATLAYARQSLSTSADAGDGAVAGELASLTHLALQASTGFDEGQRKELRYQSYLSREARTRYDQ